MELIPRRIRERYGPPWVCVIVSKTPSQYERLRNYKRARGKRLHSWRCYRYHRRSDSGYERRILKYILYKGTLPRRARVLARWRVVRGRLGPRRRFVGRRPSGVLPRNWRFVL